MVDDDAAAAAPAAATATLAAWRAAGAHRHDPVHFHVIEALAARAGRHGGAAAQALQARLAPRLAAYGDSLQQAAATGPVAESPVQPSPLAELLAHIDRQVPRQQGDGSNAATSAPELKSLRQFDSTWSRLRADQRLTHAQAAVPDNAGPLHSHQLVHRALTLMRDLSPAYLHRFMAHVDALLWLEQAQMAQDMRGEPPRKPPRSKAG